jgi:hypothetical protein
MQIDKVFQLEHCINREGHRPELEHVMISRWHDVPVAASADGFMLVVVPVVLEDGDVLGMVRPDVLIHARKLTKLAMPVRIALGENTVTYGEHNEWQAPRFTSAVANGREGDRPITYPDYIAAVDGAIKLHESTDAKDHPTHHTSLNPQLLHQVWRSLGKPRGVTLSASANSGAVLITTHRDFGLPAQVTPEQREALPHGIVPPFALIMPMAIQGIDRHVEERHRIIEEDPDASPETT